MATTKLPDGRWVVYYRHRKTQKIKKEYFGRGLQGRNKAFQRNKELGFTNLGKKPKSHAKGTETVIRNLIEKNDYGKITFEAPTRCGVVDVLTDKEIIEIKPIGFWKHALGQVLAYKIYIPNKSPRVYLHGDCTKERFDMIKLIYKTYGVELSFYGNIN